MAIVKPIILEDGQLKTAGVGDQVPQSYVQGLDTSLTSKVDKVSGKGLSDTNFTQVEKTKLDGIASEATKNRVDSLNADKVHTHTTAQVTGLDTALTGKASTTDPRFTDAREWTAATLTQAEAEAGVATTRRAFTAQRVRQAIVAWFNGISGELGRTILARTTTAQVRVDIGLDAVDNTSDVDKPVSTAVADGLALKVDKVAGKVLSDVNFTQVEKTKLDGIASASTKNRADSLNADKVHTHTTAQVTGLDDALVSKVDKVAGKQLSDTNFTQDEKDKLSSLESSKFVGLFVSESALPLSSNEGDYANVDGGVGSDAYRVIWDSSDSKWVKMQGVSTDLTPAQIKQQYESNPDTNAFTDDEKVKLASVAEDATVNRADILNADKVHSHIIDDVTGLSTRLSNIDALIGDVESVLVAINGEP